MDYLMTLTNRREIAEETMEFTFDTGESDYQFKAGQHTDFTLIDPPYTDAEGNIRTFSFVNAPGKKKVVIATRMRNTAFKNWLKEMPLGTTIQLKEPMGRMTLHQDATKPAVFLVGGIGITPFMSMIDNLKKIDEKREIYLFYANASPKTTAYQAELKEYARSNPNLHYIPSYTDSSPKDWIGETGRIDVDIVKKFVKNPAESVFYTAGPPDLVSAMIALAEKLGVPEGQIKSEDFDGY